MAKKSKIDDTVLVCVDFDETLARGHYYGVLFNPAQREKLLKEMAPEASAAEVKQLSDEIGSARLMPSSQDHDSKIYNASLEIFSLAEGKSGYKSPELIDLMLGRSPGSSNIEFAIATRNNEAVINGFVDACCVKEAVPHRALKRPYLATDHAKGTFESIVGKDKKGSDLKEFVTDKPLKNGKTEGNHTTVSFGKALHVLKIVGAKQKESGLYPTSVLLVDDDAYNINNLKPVLGAILADNVAAAATIMKDAIPQGIDPEKYVKTVRDVGHAVINEMGLDIKTLQGVAVEAYKVPNNLELSKSEKQIRNWNKDLLDLVEKMTNEINTGKGAKQKTEKQNASSKVVDKTSGKKDTVENKPSEGVESQSSLRESEESRSIFSIIGNLLRSIVRAIVARFSPSESGPVLQDTVDVRKKTAVKGEVISEQKGVAVEEVEYANMPSKNKQTAIGGKSISENMPSEGEEAVVEEPIYANILSKNEPTVADKVGYANIHSESEVAVVEEPIYVNISSKSESIGKKLKSALNVDSSVDNPVQDIMKTSKKAVFAEDAGGSDERESSHVEKLQSQHQVSSQRNLGGR